MAFNEDIIKYLSGLNEAQTTTDAKMYEWATTGRIFEASMVDTIASGGYIDLVEISAYRYARGLVGTEYSIVPFGTIIPANTTVYLSVRNQATDSSRASILVRWVEGDI